LPTFELGFSAVLEKIFRFLSPLTIYGVELHGSWLESDPLYDWLSW
jgi:hypothetical protein